MRLAFALAAAYLIGGIAVWISFVRTNPDGLANVGLVLYVFPVTIVGLVVGRLMERAEFILIPNHFGYLTAHALFFFPSLLAVAGLIGWAVSAVSRVLQRIRTGRSHSS